MRDFGLSEAELFPRLDAAGARLLRRLREHPHAPRWNWRTGERLTDEGLLAVRAFADRVRAAGPVPAGALPPWVLPFVRTAERDVPFYRDRARAGGGLGATGEGGVAAAVAFAALPLVRRGDLRTAPWAFVPDDVPAETLITYTTSGTTGTLLRLPATPELPARYLPLFERALATVGVRLEGGPERVSVAHVCAQRSTVVLHSLSSYLGGAAVVKVNLDPADWSHPDDPVRFLDDCAPELVTGDPFALWQLAALPTAIRPRALLSAGTELTAGVRRHLGARFGCPILDVYSLNESGPVAFAADDSGGHTLLSPDLYVEVCDPQGRPCPPGVPGELVLTGGLNRCLPLVRYATGDHAALDPDGPSGARLLGLHGREPILFRTAAGEWRSSVDVATALVDLPLPWLTLHQSADGALHVETVCDPLEEERLRAALESLFGPTQPLTVQRRAARVVAGKPLRFRTDLPSPLP
jgi:phenylacetate-CoA ligase